MFPGVYSETDWNLMADKPVKILQILKYNQIGFMATQMLHLAIVLIWCLATRVPGFNLYDGSEAVNANTHSGWWLAVDIMVLAMGLMAPYFTLHYVMEDNQQKVETGMKSTADWLMAYIIIAILGGVMAGVHAGLSLSELMRDCNSATFCRDYQYMQIALVILLFVLMVLLWWSAALGYTYRLNIQGAVTHGGLRPTITTKPLAGGGGGGDVEEGGQPAPQYPGASSQIMTPLLQMRMQQQQQQGGSGGGGGGVGKFRHTPGTRAPVRMK
jgi:hypothetical protein